tara:strand:- start:474 stop:827 length:354 start_codon:yes stop_codon:yes gene_type:complete
LLLEVLHGKKHWLYHRFSAIIFFPLALWAIYSLSFIPEITHENMLLWVSRTENYILLSILIMISARHFQLGIQVILEDYISTIKFRDFYIKLVNIIYYFLMFLGLIAIAKIYFGVEL